MQSVIGAYLQSLHDRVVKDRSGSRLAEGLDLNNSDDLDRFGICVATIDGQIYEAGDSRMPFPMQSISKPFAYSVALQDHGIEHVGQFIDVEPSGDAFNEISIDPVSRKANNAMINAGALVAATLIRGSSWDDRYERVHRFVSDCANRDLELDREVYHTQVEISDRNRAIAFLLREMGTISESPPDVVDIYTRYCSLLTDCRDLALMAATLANGGIQPVTLQELLPARIARHVASVMTVCGMYDEAGDWLTSVGLPAKSGVGGGIIAVLPGQCGIAVFSPRLNSHGNSVRGVAALKLLSDEMGLHLLNIARASRSTIRATYSLTEYYQAVAEHNSSRPDLVEAFGSRVKFLELQGDILFSGAERIERELIAIAEEPLDAVIIDISRVNTICTVAEQLLRGLYQLNWSTRRHDLAIVDPDMRLEKRADRNIFVNLRQASDWAEALLESKVLSESNPEGGA